MIEADTPTLWELRRHLGHPAAVAILVRAIIHAARLVNLDKNLTTEQIGEAANDILQLHGQLKVEEIKYLLKRALRTQDIYGRFDYNVLMNWVEDYDAERTEQAITVSENQEKLALTAEHAPDTAAISLEQYIELLEQRVADGDRQAPKDLAQVRAMLAPAPPDAAEQARRKHDFRKWYLANYLIPRQQQQHKQ